VLDKFDVVVVNTGAHFRIPLPGVPREENMEVKNAAAFSTVAKYETVIDGMSNVLAKYKAPSALILFRDIIGGHSGCDAIATTAPWTSQAEALEHMTKNPFHQSNTYRGLNEIAAAIYTRYGIVRLPIYNSTVLRHDSHTGGKDCLHYCIPGPSLHWSDMLAAAIQLKVGSGAAVSATDDAQLASPPSPSPLPAEPRWKLQDAMQAELDTAPAPAPASGTDAATPLQVAMQAELDTAPVPTPAPVPNAAAPLQEGVQDELDAAKVNNPPPAPTAPPAPPALQPTTITNTVPAADEVGGGSGNVKAIAFSEAVLLPVVMLVLGFGGLFVLARRSAIRQQSLE
jgi:hypothetical protein